MNITWESSDKPARHTVLIVDDNPANLEVVGDYLAKYSLQIMGVRDGETGLRLARQEQPDLILLDVRLPGIDGFEVCRRLKADERTREIPVIFMTIVTKMEDKVTGFEVGGVDYITKPFQPEEILARVITHLRIRDLTRRLKEANESLERRVAKRTTALTQVNQELQAEIAERIRTEAALKRERTLIANIMETSPVGITMVNREGQVAFANSQAEKVLGLAKDEITQRTYNAPAWRITDFAGGPFPDEKLPFQQVMATRQPVYDVQHAIEWPDGRRVFLAINGAPILDESGQVESVAFALQDITKHKQAEAEIRRLNQKLEQRVADRTSQLEAANKELEAFVYSVSHDLRAPLRHIDGFLELLQQRTAGALDERSQHYMDTISDAAKRMGVLIDDLLAFSRMGRDGMSKGPVALSLLVQDIIREYAPEIQNRLVHWHIADLPTVTGDRAMLRIVLVNLIANALKFTRPCQSAEIEIGCLSGQDNEIIVFIRDNGVGFDMVYTDKLFGVFQRLHPVDEFEGTGIGLANVRRIINRHGGRTWAEGKINQGATFYFSLPQTIQET
ncbi:MAG: response regulator [Anaerolinea sp.]|nr:response regulator [Anaerolinea sp.]